VRAVAVELPDNWLEATRYLNMDHLKEHKKEALRAVAARRRPGAVGAALHGGSAPPTPNVTHVGQIAELDAHNCNRQQWVVS
jgi:hypothetical protein